MPQPSMPRDTPPRHARLFDLLHQQERARAAAARLAARPAVGPEAVAPLARLNAQTLLRVHSQSRATR